MGEQADTSSPLIPVNRELVWQPQKGSQRLAISCPCSEILYEGTRGGGKTDLQLMFYRRFVGIGYGIYWRGIIFDLEYKNLDDLISKSRRWFPKFNDGAKFISSPSQLKWVWPTGEELLFRQMKKESDYWNYHGQEFPFIGWNELTKHPSPNMYDTVMSLNRSSFVPEEHSPDRTKPLKELPLVVFSTTNPFGVGHNWVKQRFIDVAPPGEVVRRKMKIFNPRTQKKEVHESTLVRLFSSYKENRYLSPKYVLELESIRDPNKRAAWLHGDWNITSGGMFDDVWSSEENIVEPFNIPHTWRIFRSFDWGSSKPYSVGFWAESDGSDIETRDGKVISSLRGDLFRIGEVYGWNGVPNEGLRELASAITKKVVLYEMKHGLRGRVKAGPSDNSIHDVVNGMSIANDMANSVVIDGKKHKGVQWERSDKSAGSRKNGWELLRSAIYNAQVPERGVRENPGLFVFRTCQDGFIRTVPTIPRDEKDPDDVDTNAEDHVADESRYVILSTGSRFKTGVTIGLT